MPTAATQTPPPTARLSSGKNASPRNEVLSLDEATRTHIEMVLALTQGRIEGRRGADGTAQDQPAHAPSPNA
jgi:hypothetical protein